MPIGAAFPDIWLSYGSLAAAQLTNVVPAPEPLLFARLGSVAVRPVLNPSEASNVNWCAPGSVQVTFQARETATGVLIGSAVFNTVTVVGLDAVQSGGRLTANETSTLAVGSGPLL